MRSNRFMNDALSANPPAEVIQSTWNGAANDTATSGKSSSIVGSAPNEAANAVGITAPRARSGRAFSADGNDGELDAPSPDALPALPQHGSVQRLPVLQHSLSFVDEDSLMAADTCRRRARHLHLGRKPL